MHEPPLQSYFLGTAHPLSRQWIFRGGSIATVPMSHFKKRVIFWSVSEKIGVLLQIDYVVVMDRPAWLFDLRDLRIRA